MKKIFSIICVASLALMAASCTTTIKTAKTVDVNSSVYTATAADLDIASERVTYTSVPTADIRRGGLDNVKNAAEMELLQKYGNADVLVGAEYVVSKSWNPILMKSKVKSITVSGYPAKYKNFRSVKPNVNK